MLNMIYGTMWDFHSFPHNVQNVNGLFAKLGSISKICEHIQVWITRCSTYRMRGLICSNDIYCDSSIYVQTFNIICQIDLPWYLYLDTYMYNS